MSLFFSFPWLERPSHQRLLSILSQDGGEARFVGGAIRNSLLQREEKDFDIATTHVPEKVVELLKKAGIRVVPTGFSHGTVTAILDRLPYEITTLRQDLETNGRHAKVAFTGSWKEDAARRDFTINALYLSAQGELFDYFRGVEDLEEGRIRFIGHPQQRIQEDYLRILRFFRFHAFYGRGDFDPSSLEACVLYKIFLKSLARERITREFLGLLEAEAPLDVLNILEEKGFFPLILRQETDFSRARLLLDFEMKYKRKAASLVRLSALLGKRDGVPGLCLSRFQQKMLTLLMNPPGGGISSDNVFSFLYRFPKEIVEGWIFLQSASQEAGLSSWDRGGCLLKTLEASWKRPLFPLNGEDILALGVKGKEIGKLLALAEDWWIGQNFSPTRESCLDFLVKDMRGRVTFCKKRGDDWRSG